MVVDCGVTKNSMESPAAGETVNGSEVAETTPDTDESAWVSNTTSCSPALVKFKPAKVTRPLEDPKAVEVSLVTEVPASTNLACTVAD